jgi:hypothetical protein
MSELWAVRMAEWIEWSQDAVLESMAATDPALVGRRPAATAPSIGFHAWHLARWADRHGVALAGWVDPTQPAPDEIWVAQNVAASWGFGSLELGEYGIGAGLDDDASAALPLPGPDEIGAYAKVSFDGLVAAIGGLDDAILERQVVDLYGDDETMASVLLNLLSHTDRHLGMIEGIRGVLGEHGTATV